MTLANTPATPKMGAVAPAPFAIARREAIDTALSLALHHIRRHHASPSDLQTATARARRALTLLKHASASAAHPSALVMKAPQAEPKVQPFPTAALLARVINTLETIECRVLSASADGSALSHLARRAKYDLAAIAHELAGGAA